MENTSGYKIDERVRTGVDGSELTDEIEIDRREIEWRKAFTGFDGADADRLAEMEPLFEGIAATIDEIVAITEQLEAVGDDIDSDIRRLSAERRAQTQNIARFDRITERSVYA